MPVTFGSVCSGIEAASVAWGPVGWKASWFAEIEKFPSAVLNHRFPETLNLGDVRLIPSMLLAGEIDAPDVLCGGTPCQGFSVAGLQGSLSDPRGQLSLTFCEIADEIDSARSIRGRSPCVVFWENVPGVLRTKDNAFGCFLGKLSGEVCELVAPGGRWTNAGIVAGPKRVVAWRMLDAQYFGLAQRRKRVFVVASSRTSGIDPGQILFEFDGVRRHSAPSEEERKLAATNAGVGVNGGCWWDGGGLSQTLDAVLAKGQTMPEKNRFPAVIVHGVANCLRSKANSAHDHTLETYIPIAFSCKDSGSDAGYVSPTLRSMGHDGSHANGGGQIAIAYTEPGGRGGSNLSVGEISGTIEANSESAYGSAPYVAGTLNPGAHAGSYNGQDAYSDLLIPDSNLRVRRLTPTECERLQGFHDSWTKIPWRGKPEDSCPDGPRYKAIGNSWAIPVVRWIGKRINDALTLPE